MKRRLIAALILVALPLLMAAPSTLPVSADWGYAYSRMGMSDEGVTAWGIGTGLMCAFAFTGVAGVGCLVSAAL